MLSVIADVKKLSREIDQRFKRQIPYVTSRALNAVAFEARSSIQKNLPKFLDRPTKFTIDGVQVEVSDKTKLISAVGFASRRFGKLPENVGSTPAEYMQRLIKGGIRKSKTRRGIPVPVEAKLNKFGNLSRNYLKNKVSAAKSFVATINGTEGVWETFGRKGNKRLRLLVAFKKQTRYEGGKFPLKRIVSNTVRRKFETKFRQEFIKAVTRRSGTRYQFSS